MSKNTDPRATPETIIRLIEGDLDALIETKSPSFFRRCRAKGYEPIGQRIEGDTAYFRIPRFAIAIRQCRKRRGEAC